MGKSKQPASAQTGPSGAPLPGPSSHGAYSEALDILASLQDKSPDERQNALWTHIACKEVPRATKTLSQFTTSRQTYVKRYSSLAAREAKRVTTGITANGGRTRPLKEVQMKSKRIARELIVHMKGSEKREKDQKKAAAKKEQERMKQEEELRDAQRQQRKLNFLLEQTELYGHFIGSKISSE